MGGALLPQARSPRLYRITLRVNCALTPQVPHSYARAGAGDRASPMLPAPCTPSVTCLCSRTRATTSASSLPVPAGAWATLAAPGG